MIKAITLALAVCALATPLQALSKDRTEQVRFAPGTASKTIQSRIKGYDTAQYLLRARAGQHMTVSFKTSNASGYFNVSAPGAEEALFVGSVSGNDFSATLPASGEYRIQVYLMRNAARRNETADYTLTVKVD